MRQASRTLSAVACEGGSQLWYRQLESHDANDCLAVGMRRKSMSWSACFVAAAASGCFAFWPSLSCRHLVPTLPQEGFCYSLNPSLALGYVASLCHGGMEEHAFLSAQPDATANCHYRLVSHLSGASSLHLMCNAHVEHNFS